MTTRSSPIQVLKAQADLISRRLKNSGRDTAKIGIVMDDKTLVVTVQQIQATPLKTLAKHILDLMQENY